MKFTQRLLLIILLLHLSNMGIYAQKKITYGVGLDIFQTKLNNVDRENFSGYGHSVPGFKQNDKLGFGASFLASTPIYKNVSFETGLGITNFRSQFHFNYEHRFAGWIDKKLNISLYYLKIPTRITYGIPINVKSKINFSLGAEMKFLLWGQDNYRDILYELVGFETSYNFFIPSVYTAIGYSIKLKNAKKVQIEGYFGQDFTHAIGKERGFWGFYKNLSIASYHNYGISIKYFFNH